jgi:hypothetical protein
MMIHGQQNIKNDKMCFGCWHSIWKMKRNGLLSRLHEKFYPTKVPISEIPTPVVSLVQVTPVLALLGIATLIAIVLLLLENKATYIKAYLKHGWRRLNQLLFGSLLFSPTHIRQKEGYLSTATEPPAP